MRRQVVVGDRAGGLLAESERLMAQAGEMSSSATASLTEAEQMRDAIRKNGGTVWYLMAKDEGHGFGKKKNADCLRRNRNQSRQMPICLNFISSMKFCNRQM